MTIELSAFNLALPIKKIRKTLTNDQILNLVTTPIQILPAPGSRKTIIPVLAIFCADCTAAVYSHFNNSATVSPGGFASSIYLVHDAANSFNDATGPIVAGVSDGSAGILNKQSVNIAVLNGVSSVLTGYVGTNGYDRGLANDVSLGFENFDLSIAGQNNGLGNFQGGHADNSLLVELHYIIFKR